MFTCGLKSCLLLVVSGYTNCNILGNSFQDTLQNYICPIEVYAIYCVTVKIKMFTYDNNAALFIFTAPCPRTNAVFQDTLYRKD